MSRFIDRQVKKPIRYLEKLERAMRPARGGRRRTKLDELIANFEAKKARRAAMQKAILANLTYGDELGMQPGPNVVPMDTARKYLGIGKKDIPSVPGKVPMGVGVGAMSEEQQAHVMDRLPPEVAAELRKRWGAK